MMISFLLSLALLVPSTTVAADVLKLPTFVASHMVLQREPMKARLWGWSEKGANVTAALNDRGILAYDIAGDDGSWTIHLPPQPTGVGHTITLSDGSAQAVVLEDVAFGDVYLCSGQSNMEMSVAGAFNASAEIADSANYPHLRLATVKLVTADTPQDDAPSKTNDYVWARSGPEAMNPKDRFSWYSATCYFFGRQVYKSLGGEVPIGLVTSCWGGQKVECFSSPDALDDDTCGGTQQSSELLPRHDEYLETTSDWNVEADETNVDVGGGGLLNVQPEATQLWNAMIHPLLPMRFTAAVWYQGEANVADPTSYACRFPAMIADWRRKFQLPSLGFYYVQLAAYTGGDFTLLRAAQDAALRLPKVGVAVAIDLGDPKGPAGPIHPRRKQEVGRRLGLLVQAKEYDQQHVVYSGPRLLRVQLTKDGAILTFQSGTTRGLHFGGTAACTTCCDEASPFDILTSSGNWTRITSSPVISNDSVHISIDDDTAILGIRFNWDLYPECALYNGRGGPDDHAGLAMAPFEWCAYPSGQGAWTGKACGLASVAGEENTIQTVAK